jgi:hypothetical protein
MEDRDNFSCITAHQMDETYETCTISEAERYSKSGFVRPNMRNTSPLSTGLMHVLL